jgi:small redox-active disulfide protein 2
MIMSQDEITQIKIGKDRVGIIGLKLVLAKAAETSAAQTDEEIRAELLRLLDKRNYISESSKEEYSKAFLREFKKFIGRPVENGRPDGLEIKVLGPGCSKCQQTEKIVKEAVAEVGLDANVEKITDTMEIAGYGVFGTPAVVVAGEVKSVGKIPSKEDVKGWIPKQ